MPSDLENLITIRSNLIAELAEHTAGPKRVSYTKGNQTFDWNGYRSKLLEDLKALDERIAAADGPYELEMRGIL